MAIKVLTVKIIAAMERGKSVEEIQPKELNKLLDENWTIQDVIHSTTEQNAGFLFLTYTLVK